MSKSSFRPVLILIPCVLILASCETSKSLAIKTELAAVPSEILEPCTAPQLIPEGVTVGAVLESATLDGANLDQCQDKHLALVSVIDTIETIQGSKP